MKRLRHPIRAIREPFGTAGLIVACVALIAALGGTALAAAKLNGTQKKEVEKIAKKFAGKPGAPGSSGAAGAKGDAGANGSNGADGTNGSNGVSPVGAKFAGAKSGSGCTNGGVEFTGANTTYACNGTNGTTGFTEFLPSNKTETGTWSFGTVSQAAASPAGGATGILIPISFPIPLEVALPAGNAHFIAPSGKEVEMVEENFEFVFKEVDQANPKPCAGTAASPAAAAGQLCVYQSAKSGTYELASQLIGDPAEVSPPIGFENGRAGTTGAIMNAVRFENAGTNNQGYGTWAVTAP
jgi:hypothetical protein